MKKISITSVLLLIIFSCVNVSAQQERIDFTNKYVLAIDLVPIIESGEFRKVFFKSYTFDENTQPTGALRFGLNASFLKSKDESDLTPPLINYSSAIINPIIGYEKYLGNPEHPFYYGVDLEAWYDHSNTVETNEDFKKFWISVNPFIGLKQHIYQNLSCSLEIGLSLVWNKTKWKRYSLPEPTIENSYDIDTRLPYLFTLNYSF